MTIIRTPRARPLTDDERRRLAAWLGSDQAPRCHGCGGSVARLVGDRIVLKAAGNLEIATSIAALAGRVVGRPLVVVAGPRG